MRLEVLAVGQLLVTRLTGQALPSTRFSASRVIQALRRNGSLAPELDLGQTAIDLSRQTPPCVI